MAERDDLMEIGMNAMKDAKDVTLDIVRASKAEIVNRPAFGRDLQRHERITEHLNFLNVPGVMEGKWDELETQFKNAPGTIPRRWLEYGRLVKRELDQEEKKAGTDAG